MLDAVPWIGPVPFEYYDGSAEASATVPLDASAGTVYTLEVGGGEHASGAWSIAATLTVEVL